jgi:hypothetical protein
LFNGSKITTPCGVIPMQHSTVAQKDAQPNQKRKVAHVTRKQKDEAPTIASSGFPYTYGYAAEPRRYYQYPIQFFGR